MLDNARPHIFRKEKRKLLKTTYNVSHVRILNIDQTSFYLPVTRNLGQKLGHINYIILQCKYLISLSLLDEFRCFNHLPFHLLNYCLLIPNKIVVSL